MASMSNGFNRSGDGQTTHVPTTPRFPFREEQDVPAGEARSLDFHTLTPGTAITVATRNSTYELVLHDADSLTVSVAGGRYRDEPAEGRVAGSSINGIFLSEGRIDVGLSMELEVEGRRIVTSRIESIAVH